MNDHGRQRLFCLLAAKIQRIHFSYWSQYTKKIDSFLSGHLISRELIDGKACYEKLRLVQHFRATERGDIVTMGSSFFDATRATKYHCPISVLSSTLSIRIALQFSQQRTYACIDRHVISAHRELTKSKRHLTTISTNLDKDCAELREVLGDFDF